MEEIKAFESFLLSVKTENVHAQTLSVFTNHINHINKIYEASADDSKEQYLKKLREIIYPLSDQSIFMSQVRFKPRGYAGDFLTQEMIWYGRKGDLQVYKDSTALGAVISQLVYNMEACRANEVRVHFLSKVLDDYHGKNIASLACGSAIEFWDKPKDFFSSSKVFLLDQDQGALDRAKVQIGEIGDNIDFVRQDILKFLIRPKELMGSRDLIYLFGLFDYFPIKLVKKVVKKLWDCLESKGEIIFTNAVPENPTRAFMELIGAWYLDYKNTETMLEVISGLKNVKRVVYFIDDFKVYQYVRIQKE